MSIKMTRREVTLDYDSITDAILNLIESAFGVQRISSADKITFKWDIGDGTVPDGSDSPTKDFYVNGVTVTIIEE